MRYLGGKARIAKSLTEYINNRLKPGQLYWEPFVGAGWTLQYIDSNRKRYASDINNYLICLWKALQRGWIPPNKISKEEYDFIKSNIVEEELKAFVGFGCSWGGKWFGGYAHGAEGRNYAANAKNSLMRKIATLKDVEFFCCKYNQPKPEGFLIYCDPPYAGTTEYRDKFESEAFWEWVRQTASRGNTVLVSEYKAPPDMTEVWRINTKTDMRTGGIKEQRTEKLFEYIKGCN